MSVTKKLCFVILNFWFASACNAKFDYFNSESWSEQDQVDPHSFYYDKHTREENPRSEDSDNREVAEYENCGACYKQLQKCRTAHNTDVADELLSRRFINMLISRAKWEEGSSGFAGRIELWGTKSDIEALRSFGLGKMRLREIDPILNKILLTPQYDSVYESAANIRSVAAAVATHIWNLLVNLWNVMLENKEITLGTLATIIFYYFLHGTRFNFWCKLLIFIFAVSFLITWWKLVQDAKIKHTAAQMQNLQMPIHCQPHKMNWYQSMLPGFFLTGDCEKYFEAVMREPFYQVTPAQVLSHMLFSFAYEPIALSGKAISTFLQNITAHMPWMLSWSIQTAFCLAFIPAVILLVVLLLGGTLSIGPFSILSLRGSRTSAPRQSEKERQPIEVMLNITSNLHVPPSVLNDAARSSDLAITACPAGCDESKKKNLIPRKAITNGEKAGGDCESTTKSVPSKQSDDGENDEPGVRKLKNVESGSGDNNFTLQKSIP